MSAYLEDEERSGRVLNEKFPKRRNLHAKIVLSPFHLRFNERLRGMAARIQIECVFLIIGEIEQTELNVLSALSRHESKLLEVEPVMHAVLTIMSREETHIICGQSQRTDGGVATVRGGDNMNRVRLVHV